MSNKKIRTRFAPSPTGQLHIGGLRTALYCYLFARQNQGDFILRIEDTDQNREVVGAVEKLIIAFNNVGLDYDEGAFLQNGQVVDKGEFGPYKQSQRLDLYQKYADQLIAENKAYYCFCTAERLDEMRKEQQANKMAPRYDRHCLHLSAEEVKQKIDAGMKKVVRFKIPEVQEIKCTDVVKGEVIFKGSELDDFVLLKSDNFPVYHLAHIIDDHFMQISHVIRSDEWLPSLPKHILLWQAFGWEIPVYAHLPLILNPDKSKLSKRQGDVSVEDYLAKGYLPEAIINFIALLGWNPGDGSEQEIFSLAELIEKFDLNKVNKSGAVFNTEKLDWMNGMYIRQLSVDDLVDKCLPYIENWLKEKNIALDKEYIKKIVIVEQERLKKLSDIVNNLDVFYADVTCDPQKLIWKKSNQEETKTNLKLALELLQNLNEEDFTIKNIETAFNNLMQEKSISAGNILWPVRYALTGKDKSPSPFEMAWILGKNSGIERLQKAIKLL